MENKTNTKELIALILEIIGFALSLLSPFIGFIFLGGAIFLTYKRETKEAQHLLVTSIIGLIAVTILTILALI